MHVRICYFNMRERVVMVRKAPRSSGILTDLSSLQSLKFSGATLSRKILFENGNDMVLILFGLLRYATHDEVQSLECRLSLLFGARGLDYRQQVYDFDFKRITRLDKTKQIALKAIIIYHILRIFKIFTSSLMDCAILYN